MIELSGPSEAPSIPHGPSSRYAASTLAESPRVIQVLDGFDFAWKTDLDGIDPRSRITRIERREFEGERFYHIFAFDAGRDGDVEMIIHSGFVPFDIETVSTFRPGPEEDAALSKTMVGPGSVFDEAALTEAAERILEEVNSKLSSRDFVQTEMSTVMVKLSSYPTEEVQRQFVDLAMHFWEHEGATRWDNFTFRSTSLSGPILIVSF